MNQIFQKAANHAKTLTDISEDEMLKLYGLYKQALNGPCTISKPPFWDFTGKAKWQSWKAVSNRSMDEAMKEYVTLVEQLDKTWDKFSQNESESKPTTFGVSVSTMAMEEDELEDSEKTILDWCREGNAKKLRMLLSNNMTLLTTVDENGMGLIHWAADRGHLDIVNYLINCRCDLNRTDIDGQTPLHYAASCDHIEIMKLLLDSGADTTIKDNDGFSVLDVANNKEIKLLLQ